MMITFKITCPICGTVQFITVREEDYNRYEEGELAQIAFPYLGSTERESIISGMCPDCQAEIFG